jgi:hypothetical protein
LGEGLRAVAALPAAEKGDAVSLSDAVVAAVQEKRRGVVLRQGRHRLAVYLALGGLWVDRGNPTCLEPYQPTQDELASDGWRPSDDV